MGARGESLVLPPQPSPDEPHRGRSLKSWAGYIWFMSLGTILPLPIMLGGYVGNLTIVGEPIARALYRFGIFISTLGQPPPGKEKAKEQGEGGDKKTFAERIRRYAPPGFVERHGRPFPMAVRVIWFLLIGWWLGAVWVILSWSILLFPYPLTGTIRDLLADLPSVMTLAEPARTVRQAA